MAEVWQGKGFEDVAVDENGVKVALPADARSFVCSVDNIGASSVRAIIGVEFADVSGDDGVVVREEKAYTFVSRVESQRIRFVTLWCKAGETAVCNVSFS